jgi:predicted transcriptional regulator
MSHQATVTLDEDVRRELERLARSRGVSLDVAANDALRAACREHRGALTVRADALTARPEPVR